MNTTSDSVDSWARELLPNENDMVYIRRLGGIIYVNIANDIDRPQWKKLRESDVPEDTEAFLRSKLAATQSKAPELKPKLNSPIGWYQDQKADLYYYEGEGHWREVDLKTNKKLTDSVVAGTLEYIS